MRIYMVGGGVRDIMLDRPPSDIDMLVVGATKMEFLSEFPEAKNVGKSFPVFLVNGEEYAMARTEKSTGTGHREFEISSDAEVSLANDLNRRDLTINAMALCPESGMVVGDPRSFMDIAGKVLRHTSMAFGDDPLRVFRVARFAAQLDGFTVCAETIEIMRGMEPTLKKLSAERVFGELIKALGAENPRRFFEVLSDCDCLGYWFAEIEALIGVAAGPDNGKHAGEADTFDHTMRVVERIDKGNPIARFAGLCHDMGKALSTEPPKHHNHDKDGVGEVERFCRRLNTPKAYSRSAVVFCAEHIRMHRVQEMRPGKASRLVLEAEKRMVGGLTVFLECSIGDGMTPVQADDILARAKVVFDVRLPAKYHGDGANCADIMNQIRAEAW